MCEYHKLEMLPEELLSVRLPSL